MRVMVSRRRWGRLAPRRGGATGVLSCHLLPHGAHLRGLVAPAEEYPTFESEGCGPHPLWTVAIAAPSENARGGVAHFPGVPRAEAAQAGMAGGSAPPALRRADRCASGRGCRKGGGLAAAARRAGGP